MAKILIIDDQPHMRDLFSGEMIAEGRQVECVKDAESAGTCLDRSFPNMVLLDLYLKGFDDG